MGHVGVIGLIKHSEGITDTSFDILSLEALFLVPRACSLLSLHPYFGTLVAFPAFSGFKNVRLRKMADSMLEGDGMDC